MPVIRIETKIKASKEIVFDLSRSIDLHKISVKETNEEATAGVTAGLIDLNDTVTWRAKHLGVYQTLTSKITDCDYPDYFADEMVQGAFKQFKHEHILVKKDYGTLLIDIFDYKSPLGILGKIADVLFLKKYMTNFLMKRNDTMKAFAETGQWKEVLEIKKVVK